MSLVKYLAIPYKDYGRSNKGTDCYGLVVRFYKDELGIDLPDGVEYTHHKEASDYMVSFYKSGEWEGVSHFHTLWEEVELKDARRSDVILISTFDDLDVPNHCGIHLGTDKFLHCMRDYGTCIHPIRKWEPHITGVYRYKERPACD